MMGEFGEINVGMIEALSSSDENPTHEVIIGAERWGVAEKETQKIVSQFQATVVSEERRRDVINYVQRLLRGCLGCEVFPYGSVPLKTYLPDGDIDLTAFGGANGEDTLADHIVSVLEAEVVNTNAEFVVKDVQLIRAEVKLVKCIVQNVVVDISLNQIGGLCTLCFLEQLFQMYLRVFRTDMDSMTLMCHILSVLEREVDRFIGKDHLFKQSIILIKAWCYYESRILGAHHGLISTYALETLVLYIFHFFHSTLDGPLAVLYKFLDYFSKFDWETYCVSLNGPVRISALPDLLAEIPKKGTHDLLLGNDFLRFCSETFSVPIRGVEMNSRAFPPKYLNIVDPLKDNNNLGRSVSKGNFYRIRSAFTFGAEKLSCILTSPVDDIARELRMFFSSTLDRHGSGQRPDVEDSPPRSTLRSSIGFPVLADYENIDEHMVFLGNRVTGDGKDLAASRLEGLKISNERSKISSPGDKEIVRPARMPPHAPHLYFSKEWLANGKIKDGDIDGDQSEKFEKDEVVASRGIPELNSSDLSGDYESHFISMQHGRWWYEYSSNVGAVAVMPPPPHWDSVRHPFQRFKRNGFSHGNVNGVVQNPMFYTTIPMLAPPVAFGSEEMPKHRGIGTYFPNTNRPPLGVNPSIVKGRNLGQPARPPRTNSQPFAYVESNMHDRSNLEDPNDRHPSYSPRQMLNPNANGFVPYPETVVAESGSVESGPLVPVCSRQPKSPALLRPQMTGQGSLAPTTQRPRFVPGPDRVMVKKTYHLKDEDDFPPLSF